MISNLIKEGVKMKYLNDYTELETTKALNATGAFFAFSTKQFNDQKIDGVRYVNLGAGMVAPKEDAGRLVEALGRIHSAGIAEDIKENGLTAIITRELHNHECFYTNDISDVTDALIEYPGVTIAGVLQVYNDIKQTEDFSKYY
jgi:hypothetical protein